MSKDKTWKFTEAQRSIVSEGKLCPACLGTDIECTGCNPDGLRMNYGYRCKTCNETWEGY